MMGTPSVGELAADAAAAVVAVVVISLFECVPVLRTSVIRLRCTTGFTSFFVNINDVLFCLTSVIDLFGLNCMSGARSKFEFDLSQSASISIELAVAQLFSDSLSKLDFNNVSCEFVFVVDDNAKIVSLSSLPK